MFIRYRKLENGKTRVQIVENYRNKGSVCQKVLRHVGTAKSDEELEHVRKLAGYLKETIENELCPQLFPKEELPRVEKVKSRLEERQLQLPNLVNISNLREEKRITAGFHEIYGSLFDRVGYGRVIKGKKSAQIFRDVVMARLCKPASKRSTCELLSEKLGKSHQLEQIYRMMDALKSERGNAKREVVKTDRIPQLQAITFQYSRRLLEEKVTLFFYDCTTLYFESFTEDELRRFGYSKDHKFNQGQVLLALMVTREGLPVGYEVFPGNMYEGDTLGLALCKLKERYGIDEAVIVADSGLLSEENIRLIKSSGYQYILGARLKSLSKAWQQTIVSNTDYETCTIYYKDEQAQGKEKDVLQLKDYDYGKVANQGKDKDTKAPLDRLVVSRSSSRAKKDKKDREKALEKLLVKIKKGTKPSDLISNYGYKKFLKMEGEASVRINEEKVAMEALWDGLHGVFTNTNRSEINAYAVYNQYHGLWQVEESFRIDKHDLRMRPVFHWTSNRIQAHIAICFVAFSLIRFLQHHLKQETGHNYSARRISIELDSVQKSILYDINNRDNQYVIPSKSSEDVMKIYQTMKLRRNVVPHKLE